MDINRWVGHVKTRTWIVKKTLAGKDEGPFKERALGKKVKLDTFFKKGCVCWRKLMPICHIWDTLAPSCFLFFLSIVPL